MAEGVAELIALLAKSRQAMLEALEGLAQETAIYESWHLKQLLAHIAGWEEACVTSVRAYVQGGGYEIPSYRGINVYNEWSVDTRASLNYDQVYAEWNLVRRELIEALEAVPPELVPGEMMLPWAETGTLADLVQVMADHELEHAEDVHKLKLAAGGDVPPDSMIALDGEAR
jgi:hypothetical protein